MADLTVVAVLIAQPGKEDVVRDALVALVPPTRPRPSTRWCSSPGSGRTG